LSKLSGGDKIKNNKFIKLYFEPLSDGFGYFDDIVDCPCFLGKLSCQNIFFQYKVDDLARSVTPKESVIPAEAGIPYS
jgi:hypothetical protein